MRVPARPAGAVAFLLALAAGLGTALAANLAYYGLLSPGNPGRAAMIGLVGGAITLAHVALAAALFQGRTAARYVALPVFVLWLVLGVIAFAGGGKSSGGWIGLVLGALAVIGIAGVLDAMRLAREH